MPDPYDLVVLGTGAAATTAANKTAAAGWRVAVVDSRPYGGTCALRGCDPKKVLVGAAHVADLARRMEGHGTAGRVGVDWADLMAFKLTFTEPVPESKEAGFQKKGIETLHGRARLVAEDAVVVETEGGERRLAFEHLLVATGARPVPLPFDGAEHVATSTDFLRLRALPRRVLFVGGGYVSMEFAHIAVRAGADVTVVHRGVRPLEAFDPDLVGRLADHTRDLGVDLRVGTSVVGVERSGDAFRVTVETDGGERETLEADLVVHGAGRVPEITDLDLGAAGVEHTDAGVTVDAHLRSVSNERVWAAGDCAASGGAPLTPVASHESHVVASNLLDGLHRTPNHEGVPSVAFTGPPVARVGLTEAEAAERELDVEVHAGDTAAWYTYRRVRAEVAGYKVLTHEDRVVGAHLLGPGVDDLVNVFALAVRHGIPVSALRETIWAYPTHASDVPYMV
ncbi:MAG: NAD(P)/FAD-dependent oxidoreductase [Rhodothermales bacterium]